MCPLAEGDGEGQDRMGDPYSVQPAVRLLVWSCSCGLKNHLHSVRCKIQAYYYSWFCPVKSTQSPLYTFLQHYSGSIINT